MDELIDVLREIRDEIRAMNTNIGELVDSVNEMKGSGLYNSISDVCDKLDSVSSEIQGLKGDGVYDTLSDVCDKLAEISVTLDSIDLNTNS